MKLLPLLLLPLLFVSCKESGSGKPKIGVAFETLQTEFWVAGFDAIKTGCAKAGYEAMEAVADSDANRQLEQVQNFITRKVDGIILVPKDAQTCLPMIKAANDAGIPVSLFNRPAGQSEAKSVAVVADNFALTKETVLYMLAEAKKSGRKHQAMVIMGDLADINAIGRREGFEAAVKEAGDGVVEVVARVPSEWNQEKAQAGVTNALQANPGISFIFTSSDFLLPSIVSALKAAGKYHKSGEQDHVILGGFDGDVTSWRMLQDGYLDATGVQDVYFEAKQCVQAIADMKAGKIPAAMIKDAGFVIHRGNMAEKSAQMWGANIKK